MHVPVRGGDGRVSWLPLEALEPVPQGDHDPAELFRSGRFTGPEWLRRALARERLSGELDDVLYSMEATVRDFLPWQFKPALKMLASPTGGLLVADEVGLGKTIEAGLI